MPFTTKRRRNARGFVHSAHLYLWGGSEGGEDGLEVLRLTDYKWNYYPNQTY